MSRASQRKGRAGELELCRILSGYGFDMKPGAAVSFGSTPDIVGLPGIHIEVKRREQTDISAALRQASEDAQRFGDGLPAVFTRGNRQRWRVVMALDDFITLYRRGCNDADSTAESSGDAAK